MFNKKLFIIILFISVNFQNLTAQEMSKDLTFEYKNKDARDWEKGRKYALIIGISKYLQSNIPQLKYAANDAKAIYDLFKNEQYVKYDEVILLTDADATRENILRRLSDISRKIGPQDTFFIYYSGHGKEDYLIPYNGDKEYPKVSCVRWEEDIYNEIKRMDAKQKILIIDSCHSGSVSDTQMAALGKGEISKVNINDQLLAQMGQGIFVIASSRADEISWENDKMQHAYFTYYLIEGLKGSADGNNEYSFGNEDGYVTADELYNYVSYRTNHAVTKDLNKPQHPRKSFQGEGIIYLSKVSDNLKEKGFLTINSIPANSSISINGITESNAPILKKEILPGDYEIIVESKGYKPEKKLVQIKPNEEKDLSFELKKNFGYLTINSAPWGIIIVDGKHIGITPIIKEKLDPGEHEIEIKTENEKYNSLKEKITILPDQNNIFSWELKEK